MECLTSNPEVPGSSACGHGHATVADVNFPISGQVGMDGDRTLAGDDIASQTRQAFDSVEAALSELDRDLSDGLNITAHVVGPHSRPPDCNAVYQERFSEPSSCHTVLGVEQSATPECVAEIEADVPVEGGR